MNSSRFKRFYWAIKHQLMSRHFYAITSPMRTLPNFIIIGAMKSGSTSLYNYICEHPCILPAAYDEIGFFDSNFHLGLNWYRSMFPTKKQLDAVRRKEGAAITGEDTPFYFWNKDARDRIQKLLRQIKCSSMWQKKCYYFKRNLLYTIKDVARTISTRPDIYFRYQ